MKMIWETENQKPLSIIIDRKLNFNDYITSIFKKTGWEKLSVLTKERRIFLKNIYRVSIWLLSFGLNVP